MKAPLRTKSIGTKVSEEEFAALDRLHGKGYISDPKSSRRRAGAALRRRDGFLNTLN